MQVKSIAECSMGWGAFCNTFDNKTTVCAEGLCFSIFEWPFNTGFTEFLVHNIKMVNSFES